MAPDADRRRARGELVALVLTAVLHLLFENVLRTKGPFLAVAAVLWGGWLVRRARREPGLLRSWGLRREGLGRAARLAGGVLALGVAVLAALGAWRGTLAWPGWMPVLLLLYPVWGLVQQLLLQAILVDDLGRLHPALRRPAVVTPIAALAFGAVHAPDLPLMGLTALVALVLVPLWLRTRHLLPLGVLHGWLGALAWTWVLARDPFIEGLRL